MKSFLKVIVYLIAASASSIAQDFCCSQRNCDSNVNVVAHIGSSITIMCDPKMGEVNCFYKKNNGQIECRKKTSPPGQKEITSSKTHDKFYNVTFSSLSVQPEKEYFCLQEGKDENNQKCFRKVYLNISCDSNVNVVAHIGSSVTIMCDPKMGEVNCFYKKNNGQTECRKKTSPPGQKEITSSKTHDKFYNVTFSSLSVQPEKEYFCLQEGKDENNPQCFRKVYLNISCDSYENEVAHIGSSIIIMCDNKKDGVNYFCKKINAQLLCIEHAETDDKFYNKTFRSLSRQDEGEYFCVRIDDTDKNPKCSKKVHLSISYSGVIGGVVVSVILLIAVVLLFVYRHKLPWIQGSSDWKTNSGDNTEEVQGNRCEELQEKTTQAGNVVSSVYATVNPPPDLIHYASVNFQNDSAVVLTGLETPSKPEINTSTEYSSVRKNAGPLAPETTLYSTVTKSGEP
ncbi:uncharacterized protein LOC115421519 isoform X1 [Sphaeramia orbicularis]|uniref:uncharacterized protein LOC115421519 isoform X1 n=1 Tax=Sphaeramia orbicularis TaxID=375764 RepID=UPI001180E04B|nr:uncharacterized protein LOC115421519 isoform X1 [Sphaeramia orbicularis]